METAERDTRKFHDKTAVHRVQEKKKPNQGQGSKPGQSFKGRSQFQPQKGGTAPSGFRSQAAERVPQYFRCAVTRHRAHECPFRDAKCHECGKLVHIGKAGRSTGKRTWAPPNRAPPRSQYLEPQDSYDPPTIYFIHSIENNRSNPPIYVSVEVNRVRQIMEVDTGCGVTVMGEKAWAKTGSDRKLQQTSIRIKDYSGRFVPVLGVSNAMVKYNGQVLNLPLLVVKGDRPTLLGRNWLKFIRLDWPKLFSVHRCHQTVPTGSSSLVNEYSDVFLPYLGEWKGPPARIRIKPDAVPKFHKPRPVPFALCEKVETELDRMVVDGVIEPVSHAEWAAPIVPVRKSDGSVRICGDFKVTVNQYLIVDRYPLPTAEEAFPKLSGSNEFTTLDMSRAFLQIPIDAEAQELLVIN